MLPARDLEAQAAFYGRMGFQVGARNEHPWGTENRLIQFDGSFIELITLPDAAAPPDHGSRRFSFGRHVGDRLLGAADGMSMLAMSSPDAAADSDAWRRFGIAEFEPFRFGRKGRRPDGSDMEVSFALAFATPAFAPNLCFFGCQHHHPENFWNPAFQKHENGALGVSRIVLMHRSPADAFAFMKAWAGGDPAPAAGGFDLAMGGGTLSVWTPEAARSEIADDPALYGDAPGFAAVVYRVRNLERAQLALGFANVPHRVERSRVVVPSGAAFGVLTAFEEAA